MEYNRGNESEDKFNTGNLSKDINNLNMEIRRLTILKEKKEKTKRQEEYDRKIDFERTHTIQKVYQMISDNKQVEFEGSLSSYISDIYGLKKFYISLSISVNDIYRNGYDDVNYHSRYMLDKMHDNISRGNKSFGQIDSVYPYKFQKNVTQVEYDHAVFYLKDILPIHVTIGYGTYDTDSIKFNTGYDYIYVDSGGHAYICGVSLTNR